VANREEEEQIANSPYHELIQKRLRTLRKKVTKIDKYSNDPVESLNPDQIQALETLHSLKLVIKELEDMSSQITLINKQEFVKQQEQIKEQVGQEKVNQQEKLNSLWRLFWSTNIGLGQLDSFQMSGLTAEQLSHLSSVQSMFTSGESLQDFITVANAQLSELQTDEAIKTIIQYIQSPPSPPKFTVEEVKEEVEQVPISTLVIGGTGIVNLPSGRISFLNPSEIFPEENQLNQAPQQEEPESQQLIAPASEQPTEQSDAPIIATKKNNYSKYRNKPRKNGGEDGHSNSEKKDNQEVFVKKTNDGVTGKKINGYVREKKKFVKKDVAGVKEVVA
jgi:hypothetical protein